MEISEKDEDTACNIYYTNGKHLHTKNRRKHGVY